MKASVDLQYHRVYKGPDNDLLVMSIYHPNFKNVVVGSVNAQMADVKIASAYEKSLALLVVTFFQRSTLATVRSEMAISYA